MSKILSKWYVSLVIAPVLITYLTNHFSLPLLLSDWKLSIIFSLIIIIIILAIELKIQRDDNKSNEIIKKSDTETIFRLLGFLNLKMVQEEVLCNDSWNGYPHEAIWSIIAYQHESRLLENKLIDRNLEVLFGNFNDKLKAFTDFSSVHMHGSPHPDFLIPFKDPEYRDKGWEDSKKIDKLAQDVYEELEILIGYLKRKGYWE
ncbi:hypothetical protein [Sphingobacterium sp. LRF_L2]|uniref:hypothetical protein n=1 Tax=Sphingobacterium sp. LRF_L2 TaxID=3369421 RepID=UPI003F5E299B